MKRIINNLPMLGIFFALALSACTKKDSTPSTPTPPSYPVSTFNITFNGKTISTTADGTHGGSVVAITQTDANGLCGCLSQSQVFDVIFSVNDPKVAVSLNAFKTDLTTADGTYNIANNSYIATSSITDYTDGGKVYAVYQDLTASSIVISISNANEVKGTFNVMLTYNGVKYPATGDFDYKH